MNRVRGLAVIAAAFALSLSTPAEPSEDAQQVLLRAQTQILANIERTPRYACQQTVLRQRYESLRPALTCPAEPPSDWRQSKKVRLASEDRAHLLVLQSHGREMFGWRHDAHSMTDRLEQLLGFGTAGTGDFSSFTISLFAEGAATFQYIGRKTLAGRTLMEYSYRVPQESSRYQFALSADELVTLAYRGEILIDPANAELVRFTVEADPPREAHAEFCSIRNEVELHRLPVKGVLFQLPRTTILTMVNHNGTMSINQVNYANCQEFSSESTLHFGGEEPEFPVIPESPQPGKVTSGAFPSGLPVHIQLLSGVAWAENAAGDAVNGVIERDVSGPDGAVVIPKGAAVTGRIMRLEQRYFPKRYSVLALKFDAIRIGEQTHPLSLIGAPAVDAVDAEGVVRHGQLRPRGGEIGLFTLEPRFGVGTFLFQAGDFLKLKPGLRTEWVTCYPDQQTNCVPKERMRLRPSWP